MRLLLLLFFCFALRLSAQTDSLPEPALPVFDLNLLVGDWWWGDMVDGKIVPLDTLGEWVQIEAETDKTARHDFIWYDYTVTFDPETFEEIRDVRLMGGRFLRFQPSYRVFFGECCGSPHWEKLIYLDKHIAIFMDRYKRKNPSYLYLVSKSAK